MNSNDGEADAVERHILYLEEERCRAYEEVDAAAMDHLLADDFTLVHMNGRIEDKGTFLAALKSRQRATTRSGLKIRVHGEAAIMTGRMRTTIQTISGSEQTEHFTTQTWVKDGGIWKLAAMQVAPYAP